MLVVWFIETIKSVCIPSQIKRGLEKIFSENASLYPCVTKLQRRLKLVLNLTICFEISPGSIFQDFIFSRPKFI